MSDIICHASIIENRKKIKPYIEPLFFLSEYTFPPSLEKTCVKTIFIWLFFISLPSTYFLELNLFHIKNLLPKLRAKTILHHKQTPIKLGYKPIIRKKEYSSKKLLRTKKFPLPCCQGNYLLLYAFCYSYTTKISRIRGGGWWNFLLLNTHQLSFSSPLLDEISFL